MWLDAVPWLLAGAVFVGLSYRVMSQRPAWAFGGLIFSLLSVLTAVSVAGLETSRYAATAAAFAIDVARKVPGDKRLIFQGTESKALIYYGGRKGPQIRLSDWIAANGTQDLPLLICKRKCRLNGQDLEGRVLLQQRNMGQRKFLVLFKPMGFRK
jgi:hypothetical protein